MMCPVRRLFESAPAGGKTTRPDRRTRKPPTGSRYARQDLRPEYAPTRCLGQRAAAARVSHLPGLALECRPGSG
ncbi:hypothetical protein U879_13095 [Defluviimonas sp. 20V17]|nr:hypothetical protein U879_13095 [Defluviimonas sp. 20V17]